VAERVIIDGEPGTTWTNDTEKVRYQFVCALINTCGTCLQYHMKIGAWWPIPIHHGCRCHQLMIKPGADAPHEFVDYRELLDKMPPAEQAAAIGASNYKLLKAGVVKWEDIVTRSRVRDLREVVAKKKLTVEEMTKAGVGQRWAEEAHAAVHTPEHEIVAAKRQELLQKLVGAGLSQEKIVGELAARLAARVTIAEGPEGPYTTGPAWKGGPMPGTGGSHAAELAGFLAAAQYRAAKPKAPTPAAPTPPAPTAPETPKFETHEDVEAWAKQAFPKAKVTVEGIPVASWQLIAQEIDENLAKFPGIAQRIETFGAMEAHPESIAWASIPRKEFHFAQHHWSDLENLGKIFQTGVADGYHPRHVEQAGPRYYVTHEFGHLVDGYLKDADPESWKAAQSELGKRGSAEAQKRAAIVSEYATFSPAEAFAEGYAAAKWRPASKPNEIIDRFREVLKP
jgi:hypothetical protein